MTGDFRGWMQKAQRGRGRPRKPAPDPATVRCCATCGAVCTMWPKDHPNRQNRVSSCMYYKPLGT